MGDVQEYRHREFVRAEKLEGNGTTFTGNGVVEYHEGDYLVYGEKGTVLVKGSVFEREFVLLEESVREARQFTPAGKTVEAVLEFLKENPDEVSRVKELEASGGKRRGILEYEK